jgi:ribose-phosphate pyrophosphokinase
MDELVVCNSINLSEKAQKCNKIRQLDVSQLIGEAIRRISIGDSVSSIFVD